MPKKGKTKHQSSAVPKPKLTQNLRQLNWKAIILCITLFIGIFVRFWKIEYLPYANDADELAYIWAGQSLIEFGTPISWSSFSNTEKFWQWMDVSSAIVQDNDRFPVQFIRPWFDHSFVLPLIVGGWTKLLGYSFATIPPALFYRVPMLFIALVNVVLVYAIAKKVFGDRAAFFALVLISFSPSFVFAQRMVVSENLIATGVLLSLYGYVNKQPTWTLILATSLAGLVKLPGLFILPVLTIALFAEREYKRAILYVVGTVTLILAGYLAYGSAIDFGTFSQAMTNQSSRLLGWSNPAFVLSQPGFHTSTMLDASYYMILLFGCVVFFLPATRNRRVLTAATLASLFTIWVTSAEQDMLGWYKIPLFCLLAINAAAVWELAEHEESMSQSNVAFGVIMVFAGMVLFNNLGLIRYPTQPLPDARLLRLAVGGVLAILLCVTQLKVKKKLLFGGLCVLGVLYAAQSFYIADQLFSANCKDRNCPTPTVTVQSTVKELLK